MNNLTTSADHGASTRFIAVVRHHRRSVCVCQLNLYVCSSFHVVELLGVCIADITAVALTLLF